MYINYVKLESLMLHAKFEDHMASGFGVEDFKVLPYMGLVATLVM